ncbi:MAG TPA: M56 family metallopeptidase [Woeseiaceae bacterium]
MMVGTALGVLLELAIKSSLVLGLAFLVASLCRRASAEERHLVWACALLGILALPVLPQPNLGITAAGLLPETAALLPVARDRDAPTATPAPAAGQPSAANAVPSTSITASSVAAPAHWQVALLGTYGAVSFALLVWLVVSSARIGRSLRRLNDVTHRPTLALLEAAIARNGIRRRVQAKWSSQDATPLAWGFFRPVVVLPQDFSRLPPAGQRNALAHEVAHIARWDFLTTYLAWACCAVYWFQPLAWLACRRLMQESEIACDDRVLANGASGRDYARQLVEVAKTVSALRIRAAAMADGGSVTRRITAILDPTKRRRTMSRLQSLSVLALATVLLVPFNALTAKPRTAAAAPETAAGGEPDADARSLAAAGREGEAAALLADAIVNSGAGSCSLCYDVLSQKKETTEAESRVVRRAFDLVEARARASANGNLLVALAELCRRSGDDNELDRGTWYLMEGFRLGGLNGESSLVALSILDDLGWYSQAKTLAQSLHDNPDSSLYHSQETEFWIKRLDSQLSQAEFVTSRLIEPKTSVTIEGDLMALYQVAPVYPSEALATGQEADVQLSFTLSKTGHPEDVTVVHSTNPAFDEPARDSVAQWLYAPQLVDGIPVEKPGEQVMIRFVLED